MQKPVSQCPAGPWPLWVWACVLFLHVVSTSSEAVTLPYLSSLLKEGPRSPGLWRVPGLSSLLCPPYPAKHSLSVLP